MVHDRDGSSAGRNPAFRPVTDSVSPTGPSPAPVPPGRRPPTQGETRESARAGARRLARGMTPACGAPSLFMERLEIGIDDIVEYRSSR